MLSRLRNMIEGHQRRAANVLAPHAATHSAWAEKSDNGILVNIIEANVMDVPVSRNWKDTGSE